MKNACFFQIQQIPDSSSIFDQFNQQNIYFSYFQVEKNYYLFVYAQQSIDINLLYQSVKVIEELDSKQRKIRSLRGFFLYALEIIENGEDYEILNTNLQPFFGICAATVKNIIRQNKKAALQEFLFGKGEVNKDQTLGSNLAFQQMEKKIQNLQNQVTLLQQKVINLEAKLMTVEQNSKYPLSEPSRPLESSKISQQGLKHRVTDITKIFNSKYKHSIKYVIEFLNLIL